MKASTSTIGWSKTGTPHPHPLSGQHLGGCVKSGSRRGSFSSGVLHTQQIYRHTSAAGIGLQQVAFVWLGISQVYTEDSVLLHLLTGPDVNTISIATLIASVKTFPDDLRQGIQIHQVNVGKNQFTQHKEKLLSSEIVKNSNTVPTSRWKGC